MSRLLTELPLEKWSILRDLYKGGNQLHIINSYHLIAFFIKCLESDTTSKYKIYVLNDDSWLIDGNYIATFQLDKQPGLTQLFCNTLSDELRNLIEAFSLFEQRGSYSIHSFWEHVMPAVEKFFEFCGNAEFNPIQTYWYQLNREQAEQLEIDIPENINIAPIDVKDIDYINSVWPHRYPNSQAYLQHLVEHNLNAGIYERESGRLLAWCMQGPNGYLGALQVAETEKRKGFGSLVVRYMAKLVAQHGYEVLAPVLPANVASCKMFEKLGFIARDKVYSAFKEQQK